MSANRIERWVALILFMLAGLIGIMMDHYLPNNYVYRTMYCAIGNSFVVVAYSLWAAVRKTNVNLSYGLFGIATSAAGIFNYWWLYSWLARPTWYRDSFYFLFVFFCCTMAVSVGLLLVTIGHTKDRARRYLIVLSGIFVLAAIINLFGPGGMLTGSLTQFMGEKP